MEAAEFSRQVLHLVERYIARFPGETGKLARLVDLLNTAGLDVRSRRTLPGHLTASAFVVDATTSRLLLIHHRKLNMWLQPGGHLEAGETLQQAARRELVEEVGDHAYTLQPWHADLELPIDIDIHAIPAHPARNEPAHFHHDFRYLFLVNGGDWVEVNDGEAAGYKWIGLDDVQDLTADLKEAAGKIRNVMDCK